MTQGAGEVYRQLAPVVLGYLRAQGANDPDDLLGEVFLHVARDLPRFRHADDDEAIRRWVFAIARNRLIDDRRHRARRPIEVAPELAAAIVIPQDVDLPDPALVDALRRLTDDQREVLSLRFVADLSLDDVAALTKRSVGAIKALQHRALENLRKAVSPQARPTL